MAKIEGVDLPGGKRIEFGLTRVYGIGPKLSRDILAAAGIDLNRRVRELTSQDVAAIQRAIAGNYKIEGDLRKEVTMSIKRLQEIGSYRGLRHKRSLPVRGQRTHTNARTRKGPKRAGGQVALKRTVTKK